MAITAGSEEPDPPPEPMSEEVTLGEDPGDGYKCLGQSGLMSYKVLSSEW